MRTFNALYDSRTEAEAAQNRLKELGILEADRIGLHDGDTAGAAWSSPEGAVPPAEDRRLYEESLKRGGFLLTVNVDDTCADQAHEVLEHSGAIDVDERERHYREAGYLADTPAPPAAAVQPESQSELLATSAQMDRPQTYAVEGETIPMVEERLRVGKRETERGAVRLRSYVVEQPVHEQVSLREEHLEIERRPVNQPIENADALLQERTIEATERAEEAVITKQAFVREEVTLRKDVTERTEDIEGTVRHTEVDLEGGGPTRQP